MFLSTNSHKSVSMKRTLYKADTFLMPQILKTVNIEFLSKHLPIFIGGSGTFFSDCIVKNFLIFEFVREQYDIYMHGIFRAMQKTIPNFYLFFVFLRRHLSSTKSHTHNFHYFSLDIHICVVLVTRERIQASNIDFSSQPHYSTECIARYAISYQCMIFDNDIYVLHNLF